MVAGNLAVSTDGSFGQGGGRCRLVPGAVTGSKARCTSLEPMDSELALLGCCP